jgi:hypothetical protein
MDTSSRVAVSRIRLKRRPQGGLLKQRTTVSTTEWTANGRQKVTTTLTAALSIIVSDLNLKGEWVKIRNAGHSSISLPGWKIVDEGKYAHLYFRIIHVEPGK